MTEVASSLATGKVPSAAPKSWSAKLCLGVCLGLFVVIASFMSGFDTVVIQAVAALLADWRIAAWIAFGVATVGGMIFGVYRFPPSYFVTAFLAFLLACIPLAWFMIFTATTNDGAHVVSAPLVSALIATTLLFAACAGLHFGPFWGASKASRFFFGFLAASTAALLFSSLMVAIAFDNFEAIARAAAKTSFGDLHPGQTYVDPATIEMNGYKFRCYITFEVSCLRISN